MERLPFQFIISASLNVLMLILLSYLILKNMTLDNKVSKAYRITIILTIITIVAEVATAVAEQLGPHFRWINIVFNIIGFMVSACIPLTLAMIFETTYYRVYQIMIIPILINTMLILTSPWTGWFFYINEQNEYTRGPLFFVYILTYLIGSVMFFIATYSNASKFQNYMRHFVYVLFAIFLIGTSIQVFYPRVHSSWHCISIVLVAYYIFICELQFKYDITTQVLNRQAFENELKCIEREEGATLIAFDLNEFKQINDTYGHQQGDYYLKTIAQIIKNSFKEIGKCYRIGGDEFCVISSSTKEEEIREKLLKMEIGIKKSKKRDSIVPGVAYGYSMYKKGENESVSMVLKKADEALYEHKKQNASNGRQ